jgi:ParB family transcriptional regulator, chromosome partitioning protein
MATRKALGRGLSALIPGSSASPRSLERVEEPRPPAVAPADAEAAAPLFIAISRIVPNPAQPRKTFRNEELATLAASIREQGILQPLVVRRRQDGYELIIGERRWRAAQLVGLEEVPAVIIDATDRSVIEMALVENVQRAELNAIELAEAFQMLVHDEGMTQEEVGRRVGLERSSVANHLRLLELPSEIQQDVVDGRIAMGHAKAILQVSAPTRARLRDQIVRQGLSVRASEELARRTASSDASSRPQARTGPTRDIFLVDLEDRMRRTLQTKVRIIGRRGRGRIELHFFGDAELERLADRLFGERS